MSTEKNIFTEIGDSIKAKMYDFNYSPFMSSFVISWIILNHKYLLIYFSDIQNITTKLTLLNDYKKIDYFEYAVHDDALRLLNNFMQNSNFFWFPLLIALFYVFIYPLISHKFFKYTGEMENEKKSIRLEFEKKKKISDEEKEEIYLDNYKLKHEIRELKIKSVENETEYEKKTETLKNINFNLIQKCDKLEDTIQDNNTKIIDYNNQTKKISDLENKVITYEDTVQKLKKMTAELNSKNSQNQKQQKEIEHLNSLLNETNKKIIDLENFLQKYNNKTKQIEEMTAELNSKNSQNQEQQKKIEHLNSLLNETNKKIINIQNLEKDNKTKEENEFKTRFNINNNELEILKIIYKQGMENISKDGILSIMVGTLKWNKFKSKEIAEDFINNRKIIERSRQNTSLYNLTKSCIKKLLEIYD